MPRTCSTTKHFREMTVATDSRIAGNSRPRLVATSLRHCFTAARSWPASGASGDAPTAPKRPTINSGSSVPILRSHTSGQNFNMFPSHNAGAGVAPSLEVGGIHVHQQHLRERQLALRPCTYTTFALLVTVTERWRERDDGDEGALGSTTYSAWDLSVPTPRPASSQALREREA
jgi:hypothetical protein